MNIAINRALELCEAFNDYLAVKNYFLSLSLDAPNYIQVYERVLELRNLYNSLKN